VVSKFFKKIFFVFTFLTISFSINLFFQSSSFAAVGTTCVKTGADDDIEIVDATTNATSNGVDGTQTYGSGTKAPFRYLDGIVDSEKESNNTEQCQEEPDEYQIKFYEFYLCKLDPYNGTSNPDFSSCSSIFSNSAGKVLVIKPDEDVNLLEGTIELAAGTYPYAAVIVSNHLNIKHVQGYALSSDGSAPNLFGFGNDGSEEGQKYCYSIAGVSTYSGNEDLYNAGAVKTAYTAAHGVTVLQTAPSATLARLKCTDSLNTANSNAAFQTEIIDHLGDDSSGFKSLYPYESSGYDSATNVVGVHMAANMLQDDNATIATDLNNAKRINAFFRYDAAVVINESTVGLKLLFNTKGSVSIDFNQDTTGTTDGRKWAVKMGADPFMVKIQTKERRGRRGRTGDWR
jgi:hypothetical protein